MKINMSEPIFRSNYCNCYQESFKRALADGDLEKAAAEIKKFPQATTISEALERAQTLEEAYSALLSSYEKIHSSTNNATEKMQEFVKTLSSNNPREALASLEIKLDELKKYQELGDIKQLTKDVKKLAQYEKIIESPEGLSERLREADKIEYSHAELEKIRERFNLGL